MTTKLKWMLAALFAMLTITACDDPRTSPVNAPSPAHTETIALWEDEPSNGSIISATFDVTAPLAQINQEGIDQPARLSIAAFIRPDSDILWYEAIVSDSLPAYDPPLVRYLVGIETYQGILDSVAAVRALCDTVPEECPEDTSGLIPAVEFALDSLPFYQDSLAQLVADTTALGARRDSLGLILDERFMLTLWLDGDTSGDFPEALLDSAGRLGGQAIYLAETSSTTGFKGRGFQLNLAEFYTPNLERPGRVEQINWTECFPGSDSPCLSVGAHTLRARVSGAETKITAAIVLVYAEEQQ